MVCNCVGDFSPSPNLLLSPNLTTNKKHNWKRKKEIKFYSAFFAFYNGLTFFGHIWVIARAAFLGKIWKFKEIFLKTIVELIKLTNYLIIYLKFLECYIFIIYTFTTFLVGTLVLGVSKGSSVIIRKVGTKFSVSYILSQDLSEATL